MKIDLMCAAVVAAWCGCAVGQPVVNVPEEPFPSLEFFAANPGTVVNIEGREGTSGRLVVSLDDFFGEEGEAFELVSSSQFFAESSFLPSEFAPISRQTRVREGVDFHGAVINVGANALLDITAGSTLPEARLFVRNVTIEVAGGATLEESGSVLRIGLASGAVLRSSSPLTRLLTAWNGGRIELSTPEGVTDPLITGDLVGQVGEIIAILNGGELEVSGTRATGLPMIALVHDTMFDGPLRGDPVFERPPRLVVRERAVLDRVAIYQGGEVEMRDRSRTRNGVNTLMNFRTNVNRNPLILADAMGEEPVIPENVRPTLRLGGGTVDPLLVSRFILDTGPLDIEIVGDSFRLAGEPVTFDGERFELSVNDATGPGGLLFEDLTYIAPDGLPAYFGGATLIDLKRSIDAVSDNFFPRADDELRVFLAKSEVADVAPRTEAELAAIPFGPRGLLAGESLTLTVPPEFEGELVQFAFPPVVLSPGSSLTVDGASIEGVVLAGGGELVLTNSAVLSGRRDSVANSFFSPLSSVTLATLPAGGTEVGVTRFNGESRLRMVGATVTIAGQIEMRDRSVAILENQGGAIRLFDDAELRSGGPGAAAVFGYRPAELDVLAFDLVFVDGETEVPSAAERAAVRADLVAAQDAQSPSALFTGGDAFVLSEIAGSTAAIRGGTPAGTGDPMTASGAGTYIVQGAAFVVDGQPVEVTRARRAVLEIERETVALAGVSAEGKAFDVQVTADTLILEAPGAFFPIADFSGDEIVNISDLFAFIRAFQEQDDATDVDGSGVVNITDLFAYVEAFTSLEN